MTRLMLSLTLIAILQSCESVVLNPNSVEGKLSTKINENCSVSDSCTIRIKDVTRFDWDKLCVFKYTARGEEIQKVIGSPFPSYEEFKRTIIFIEAGRVVYSEQNPTDVEKPIKGEVVFDIPDNVSHRCYTGDPVFNVLRKGTTNGNYYELSVSQP